jgi:hypothetical protein
MFLAVFCSDWLHLVVCIFGIGWWLLVEHSRRFATAILLPVNQVARLLNGKVEVVARLLKKTCAMPKRNSPLFCKPAGASPQKNQSRTKM